MKIDFSRLDALRTTATVPEGFEPVPEAETPFDSGYEAMYRAAWDFHLETDDRLRAAAGEARETRSAWSVPVPAMQTKSSKGRVRVCHSPALTKRRVWYCATCRSDCFAVSRLERLTRSRF